MSKRVLIIAASPALFAGSRCRRDHAGSAEARDPVLSPGLAKLGPVRGAHDLAGSWRRNPWLAAS